MSVVVLTLAYDGTDFHGWARQRDPSIRTIEGELASHLERVLREPVKLSVAGRTDAGVHARGQVASFRTASSVEPDRLRKALNTALAPEVVVVRASRASDGFDARFSASAREYRYRIREADIPDPFTARFVWDRRGRLSLAPMRAAARLLSGGARLPELLPPSRWRPFDGSARDRPVCQPSSGDPRGPCRRGRVPPPDGALPRGDARRGRGGEARRERHPGRARGPGPFGGRALGSAPGPHARTRQLRSDIEGPVRSAPALTEARFRR